ncbi:MAG: hypothetical protein IKL07_01570 [Clostridium sp.]|nr:hypothetical protein [Clostridium sp.]
MVERLKQIPGQIVEMWKNLTRKQKVLIFSVVAAVLLTILVLYFILSKVEYTTLYAFEDNKSASEMVSLLKENNIDCRLEEDKVTVSVNSDSYQDAVVVMGTNDIPTTGMSWKDALNNSLSTTQQEKEQKFNLAFQNDIRSNLMKLDYVKDAAVYVKGTSADNTIFADDVETSVSVMLTLKEPISAETANGVAKMLAGAVGNSTTEKITIIDNESNVLFSGDEEDTLGGKVSSSAEYKEKLRNTFQKNVKEILLACDYDDVEVSAENLQFNMDKITEMSTEYTAAEGQDQGLYNSTYEYKATGANTAAGIPGTDSNDESIQYEIMDNGSSKSEVILNKADYLPNETVKNIEYEVGAVDTAKSSIGVVLTKYRIYNQDTVQKDGTLGDLTWEQFVEQNNRRTQIELEDGILNLISQVTGVSENSIGVTVWEQPIFNDSVQAERDFSNIIMIVLVILIIALLAFVVIRSMAPVQVTETEPELSVEELLATTKETQALEDIEISEKSETRRLIEKFVDENPEAVAQLLRNWLNDDWG